MREEVVEQLLALNREFYRQFAAPFAQTRANPQPGFFRLLEYIPKDSQALLDVGCGEGRFGRFLFDHDLIQRYTGVDFSEELLEIAADRVDGEFERRDLSRPDCLAGLGEYAIVACLATLQHIPGRHNRLALLGEMGRHLETAGLILLSTWQFLDSVRQERKVVEWSEAGIDPAAVEPNDYLLTWNRGGLGLRYVTYIGPDETARLAEEAGLHIVDQFRSDGREENLNLYTVLSAID